MLSGHLPRATFAALQLKVVGTGVKFVLIARGGPDRLLELIRYLGNVFSGPPVIYRRGFTVAPFSADLIPQGISFIEPRIRAG